MFEAMICGNSFISRRAYYLFRPAVKTSSTLGSPDGTPLQELHRFCTTPANEAGPTYPPSHFLSPSPSFHREAITVPYLAAQDPPSSLLSPVRLRTDADLHGYDVPPLTLLSRRRRLPCPHALIPRQEAPLTAQALTAFGYLLTVSSTF
jgi:hypothetical protein